LCSFAPPRSADEQHLVFARAGVQPKHGQLRERGLEVGTLVADFEHQHRVFGMRRGFAAAGWRMKSMPSVPPASASAGSARYSAGNCAMLWALT
jgi:hypothetical protein